MDGTGPRHRRAWFRRGGLWSVAGMDLVLLTASAVAVRSAMRLRKTGRLAVMDRASRRGASKATAG